MIPDSFSHSVTNKSTFFYVNGGLVASTNMVWFQWLFDVMIGLFDQVGLWTNVVEKVMMVFRPVPIKFRQSTPEYGRNITGNIYSHQLR